MTVAESLLPEFDHEMGVTRKLLERVPESKASWKPHPKSRSLADLAGHVSNIPSYLIFVLKQNSVDSATEFKRPPGFTTTQALLDFFDQNVRNARQALVSAVESEMTKTWTLRRGDQVIFSRPRAEVLRSFVMSHHIHHRGQLTVYLRMQDVPLPSVYGPTADQL